jgi:hypothetical protein
MMGRFSSATIQQISNSLILLILLILLCSLSPLIIISINIETHQHTISVETYKVSPNHQNHHSDEATEDACCVDGDTILGAVSELLRLLIASGLLLLSISSIHKYIVSNDYFKQVPYKRPLFPPIRILHCTYTI